MRFHLSHISGTCSNCQGEFTNLVDHFIHECFYLKGKGKDSAGKYSPLARTYSCICILLGVESTELLHILSERSDNFKTSCTLNNNDNFGPEN